MQGTTDSETVGSQSGAAEVSEVEGCMCRPGKAAIGLSTEVACRVFRWMSRVASWTVEGGRQKFQGSRGE